MKSFENIFKLHRLLRRSRYPVKLTRIMEELRVSEITVRRLIREMRNRLNAPIEVVEDPQGYCYTDKSYELPGFWFSPTEVMALLTLQQLLKSFEPGLLGDALEPLLKRLDKILNLQGLLSKEGHRIRLLRAASCPPGSFFGEVASAVLQRHRLTIDYCAPGKDRAMPREVSPQRICYYRDKWYLDAWCHKQNALRTFAVHRIRKAAIAKRAAADVDEGKLDLALGSSYGILAGEPTAVAKLLFTQERGDRIEGEQWHPAQKAARLKSGEYLLEVPYGRSEELILDILRYGADVEVLEPMDLREAVAEQLRAAAARYPKAVKRKAAVA